MSAAKNTVTVSVRQSGGTNIARAGSGEFATTASSTNSGHYAALHAAAKYFARPEAEIELSQTQRGAVIDGHVTPDYYLAWTKAPTVQVRQSKILNPKSAPEVPHEPSLHHRRDLLFRRNSGYPFHHPRRERVRKARQREKQNNAGG